MQNIFIQFSFFYIKMFTKIQHVYILCKHICRILSYDKRSNMKSSKIIGYGLLFVIMLSLTVCPAFGAVTIKDKDGNVRTLDLTNGEVINDTKNSDDDAEYQQRLADQDAEDKILSDDTLLGFERKHDVDPFEDFSVQKAIDLAASLGPAWNLAIVIILLLCVFVGFMYISVVAWNTLKGGKAAHGDNPLKAAQGIKDSKGITRAYSGQVIEAVLCVAGVIFIVALFI